VYGILKKYLSLRESMRPYIRGLMKEAHERGAPVMEAGARKRPVYLPPGAEWRELHSGETYEGGQTITAGAPLEVIPVFLRNGNPSLSACWPAG
jgi:alpha-D-xyloside xylohydrolase